MRDNEQKTDSTAALLAALIGGASARGRILDVGCGNGTMLASFSAHARSLTGVDIDESLLERARVRLPGADLRVGSIVDGLPFESGSFDVVLFCDVIEHLHAPIDALRELARVVVPGGDVLITTPNAGSPSRRLRGKKWFGLQDPTHLYFFDRFTLEHLARKSSLCPKKTTTVAFTGNVQLDRAMAVAHAGGTLAMVAGSAARS